MPATTRSSCERGHFAQGRVQDVVAVDVADPRAADRPEERDPRDRQGRGGADHRDDVGIVFEIMAQHRADDLGFIDEPGNEERPQRPIDQSRNQRLLFGWPTLTLEEAARDLSGGKGLFLVVDRKGKEVLTRLCRFHRDRGAQHRGLAISGEHRTIGLTSDFSGLEHETASAPDQFLTINMEHFVSSFSEI